MNTIHTHDAATERTTALADPDDVLGQIERFAEGPAEDAPGADDAVKALGFEEFDRAAADGLADNLAATEEDRLLARFVRAKARIAGEVERVRAACDAMVRELESRAKGLDYVYGPAVEATLRRKLEGRKARSVKTPFGTIGLRATPMSIDVADGDALARWVEEHSTSRSDFYRESIDRAALLAHVKATGDVPDGVEVRPPVDRLYVK